MRDIRALLTPAVIAMGRASRTGSRDAVAETYDLADEGFAARLAELLADYDDGFLASYLGEGPAVSPVRLRGELAAQTGWGLVHPVYFGSAITGAGTRALSAGIRDLLPGTGGSLDGPASATIFKIERGPAGEKIAYARMFSGQLHVRDRLCLDSGQQAGPGPHSGPGGPQTGPGGPAAGAAPAAASGPGGGERPRRPAERPRPAERHRPRPRRAGRCRVRAEGHRDQRVPGRVSRPERIGRRRADRPALGAGGGPDR